MDGNFAIGERLVEREVVSCQRSVISWQLAEIKNLYEVSSPRFSVRCSRLKPQELRRSQVSSPRFSVRCSSFKPQGLRRSQVSSPRFSVRCSSLMPQELRRSQELA